MKYLTLLILICVSGCALSEFPSGRTHGKLYTEEEYQKYIAEKTAKEERIQIRLRGK